MLEEPHKKIMNYDNSNTNLAAAQNVVEALFSTCKLPNLTYLRGLFIHLLESIEELFIAHRHN